MEAQEQTQPGVRKVEETPADNRRGGDVRTLLSPKTVGSTSGFMGVATIPAGDWISEHYHPYSEEFIYVCSGHAHRRPRRRGADRERRRGALSSRSTSSTGCATRADEDAFIVFHLGPLAPRPDAGHVDTEERNP